MVNVSDLLGWHGYYKCKITHFHRFFGLSLLVICFMSGMQNQRADEPGCAPARRRPKTVLSLIKQITFVVQNMIANICLLF